MSSPKRVLVTGGTGFIGANLTRKLVKDGHAVELLVRDGFTKWRIRDISDSVKITLVSLSDLEALRQAVLSAKPDWIFHMASYGAYQDQMDWKRMIHTNVIGTSNLLQAAREAGFNAFINSGSSSEYGFKPDPASEDDLVEPDSDYAVSKVAATHKCVLAGRSENLPVCTLRLCSVFGPFDEPTRLIPALVVNGLKGALPPVANPASARDFIYVDDVVEAYLAAAVNADRFPGHVFNVGSGVQTTLAEAVAAARGEFKISEEPVWRSIEDRICDGHRVADNGKIVRELAWNPRNSFAQGLAKFGRWLKFDIDRFRFYESHARA